MTTEGTGMKQKRHTLFERVRTWYAQVDRHMEQWAARYHARPTMLTVIEVSAIALGLLSAAYAVVCLYWYWAYMPEHWGAALALIVFACLLLVVVVHALQLMKHTIRYLTQA
jgi:membrane protein YdbS with pleckstrin-like domain